MNPVSEYFLVCGLGTLGQNCVVALKQFGVKVIAIEQQGNNLIWEIDNLQQLLDKLILGDCRQNSILEQAEIKNCRAALIVTSNEKINAETALAIRQLNPHTRLVVRSAQENLNRLLSEQLGNFIAYEPTQLPAAAFAMAALGTETLAFFSLDGRRIRVIKREIRSDDPWFNTRKLFELNTQSRRILAHFPPFGQHFHQWNPDANLREGDTIIYLETADKLLLTPTESRLKANQQQVAKSSLSQPKILNNIEDWFKNFWRLSFRQQVQKVAILCGFTIIILLVIGTILFHNFYQESSFLSAFYATAILLLGGYSDLFGQFEPEESIPAWVQGFALFLTLAGTAFVGVLYALLTEALLSSKFEFTKSRPPVPLQDHIVIIGLGRVGRKVAALLEDFRQSIVGITFDPDFDRSILPKMPLIVGNLQESLLRANLSTAKSIIVATDDEILNLEIALMARAVNSKSHLVIRTYGQGLTNHLTQLLPNANVLGAYGVAAEAFAGAAFGENIISLFRLNNRTILVTEYEIEAQDTLHGLLLSEVAYGYGVEVILHQKPRSELTLMPSDDIQLSEGDRLVVLASTEGLSRIEQGKINHLDRCYFVRVEKVSNDEAAFEGANLIALISGCSLNLARELMNQLPATLNTPLYPQQAKRLVRELNKRLVKAEVVRK